MSDGVREKRRICRKTCDKPHYPYELPKGWCWTTLGEISNYGTTINIQVENIEKNEWILELEDVEKETANIIQKLSKGERSVKGTRHKFNTGDILYSKLRTYLNKVLVATSEGYCTTEIMPLNTYGIMSNEYVCHVLRSPFFFDYTLQCGYGVKMPRLSTTDACNGFIPLPPLKEQIRIVEEIRRWFALIDIIESGKDDLQETIKQTKSKILNLAIHGKLVPQDPNDEPATELLKRINPKAENTCDTPHYRKLPFQIPSTWAWCSHNDVLEISGGSQPAKRFFSSVPQKGYVRLYQIRDYGENPIPVYIPIEYAMKQTEEGDILLARYGGSLGKVFHAQKGAYNVAMAKVIFKDKDLIKKEYAYFYYLSDLYQGRLKEISRTAQAGFNSSDFNEMYFPLPPYEEQQRIVNAINKAFTTLDVITENL